MKIDAHQHFWKYDPVRDAWINEDMAQIRKDFMPDDLLPVLKENAIDGCVAVQADQSLVENDFLLSLADQHDWIKGVVGWLDLLSPQLSSQLDQYKMHPRFRGVRHILQAESDGFMTQKDFVDGIRLMHDHGLSYDILTYERQLDEVIELIKALPEMPLVIDHISKPNIKEKSFDHWYSKMKEISAFGHVHVKLSGMVTEADWHHWTSEDLVPYIEFCLTQFGPQRLMYGSDWPVCLVASSYENMKNSLLKCISTLSPSEQAWIMGGTASRFYNLESLWN